MRGLKQDHLVQPWGLVVADVKIMAHKYRTWALPYSLAVFAGPFRYSKRDGELGLRDALCVDAVGYKGTSLIRNNPCLAPYSRLMPRALWWSQGGGTSSSLLCA